jgi:alpha-galactosidase
MAMMRVWIRWLCGEGSGAANEHVSQPERQVPNVPFSFMCGTRSSRDWIKPESATRETDPWQNGKRVHRLRWSDHESALSCTMELTEFSGFPAMEWVVRLHCDGPGETALIHDFKALDTFWSCAAKDEVPELGRAYGSDCRHDDFQYVREEMRQSMWDAGRTIRMDGAANAAFRKVRNGSLSFLPVDQRPSATWLPFFNLRTGSDGLFVALGWSGRWFAEFAHDGNGTTGISAGMEHLNLRLQPGEQIRSPRIALLHWKGTSANGHNIWRQFVLKHHSPSVDGQPVQAPVCNGAWGGTPTQGHLELIERINRQKLPYDYYWVDAGWYGTSTKPCPNVFEGEWAITGDWRVNPLYHPQGLKPVSDAAHRAGMKFLLWIEPERATWGTPVTLEHPEWFLRASKEPPKQGENLLLNLADPGAWNWAVETVSTLITENGIDCYREDFNMDPGPYWDAAEEAGGKGRLEIRFVEGLYAFWDELHRRHPGLLIDNCASGGRRLELETISRSLPLWRTDYNCFPQMRPEASQTHTAGLQLWLPLNSTSPLAKPGDTYQVRSAYSAGLILSLNEFGLNEIKESDYDWYRQRLAEFRRLRPYFLGAYYLLTTCMFDLNSWLAYQLILPDKQEGAVLAFRRPESPMSAGCFRLQGLDPEGIYTFEDADGGPSLQATGRELLEKGLTIALDTPRASRLFFYTLSKKGTANKPDAGNGK